MLNYKLDKKMEGLAKVQQTLGMDGAVNNKRIVDTFTYLLHLCITEEELRARQQEIEKLKNRIENQELSAHDIEQMAQERARLTDQLHHNLALQDEIQTQIKKDENRAADTRDRVRFVLAIVVVGQHCFSGAPYA